MNVTKGRFCQVQNPMLSLRRFHAPRHNRHRCISEFCVVSLAIPVNCGCVRVDDGKRILRDKTQTGAALTACVYFKVVFICQFVKDFKAHLICPFMHQIVNRYGVYFDAYSTGGYESGAVRTLPEFRVSVSPSSCQCPERCNHRVRSSVLRSA